jgi:phosphoribosyl 1,2-cyclic phosphodiesterase
MARFTVLASGSAGNASLVQSQSAGVLIDFGLGPRTLAGRMAARDLSWRHVRVAVLTHTHSDHWNEKTLAHFGRHGIRLWCHSAHLEEMSGVSESFDSLYGAGLVDLYQPGKAFDLAPGLAAVPLSVRHDGETYGFRFEGDCGLFGPEWSLGYAADLGCWDNELARSLADVDLLALEFNHDEEMQRSSGRPDFLIRRVLGDCGHLSNRQAGGLLGKVLAESTYTSPGHVVPLHLSRECNRPELASKAARAALGDADRSANVVLASQHEPGQTLVIGGRQRSRGRPPAA